MIDLGDTITLTYPSKPASPASVTVTIGLPDGTTTSPVSATSGTYTYATVQAGRHTVLWVAAGPSDSYADSFDVAEPSRAIISLDDAKSQLKFPASYTAEDEDLRLVVESATALIEHEVGPVIPATHVEIKSATETILLAKAPVLELVSVAPTFTPPGGLDFGIPAYTLENQTGLLRQQPFFFSPWGFDYGPAPQTVPWQPYGLRLTITYRAGRTTVPAALQEAARLVVSNMWKSRRIAGSQPTNEEQAQMYGRESMTPDVYQLIRPYRRSPQVA